MLLATGLLAPNDFNDPIGNEYQILSLHGLMGMRHFIVLCAGIDGKMNTGDDIRVIGHSGGKAEIYRARNYFIGGGATMASPGPVGPAGMAPPAPRAAVAEGMAPIRVRQFFPETLWVKPNIITDPDGEAALAIPVADSITTWRLNALASSAKGGVGSATAPLRVFQDFFVDIDLPAGLSQNDELSIPVSVSNYLPQAQTVTLQLDVPAENATTEPGPWFELSGGQTQQAVTMQANEVGVVPFHLKAIRSGTQKLRVTARGTRLSDAVKRAVEVLPDGRPIWQWSHDRLQNRVEKTVVIPRSAIEGASLLSVRLHPSGLSQVVEGLEKILRMPTGCFEQAASATYPNVLVLNYLKQTRQLNP